MAHIQGERIYTVFHKLPLPTACKISSSFLRIPQSLSSYYNVRMRFRFRILSPKSDPEADKTLDVVP